ncbi:hypothetical protein B0T17DRAFT_631918 [Bombardia bombarda]|uniref:Uncharacterized protein n=1 Tax=Bombardia bombarda TaxID=252184 RepID=A0AA40C8H5_9PEZI|nr:hypothetical protein B0T17DRAFT_631918 [Bombardia bombarda]
MTHPESRMPAHADAITRHTVIDQRLKKHIPALMDVKYYGAIYERAERQTFRNIYHSLNAPRFVSVGYVAWLMDRFVWDELKGQLGNEPFPFEHSAPDMRLGMQGSHSMLYWEYSGAFLSDPTKDTVPPPVPAPAPAPGSAPTPAPAPLSGLAPVEAIGEAAASSTASMDVDDGPETDEGCDEILQDILNLVVDKFPDGAILWPEYIWNKLYRGVPYPRGGYCFAMPIRPGSESFVDPKVMAQLETLLSPWILAKVGPVPQAGGAYCISIALAATADPNNIKVLASLNETWQEVVNWDKDGQPADLHNFILVAWMTRLGWSVQGYRPREVTE